MDLDQLNGNLLVSYGYTHVPVCGWQLLASFTCLAGDYFMAGGWHTIEWKTEFSPTWLLTLQQTSLHRGHKIHIISHGKHTHLYLGLLKGLSNYGSRLKTHNLDLVIFHIAWMWFLLIQEPMK